MASKKASEKTEKGCKFESKCMELHEQFEKMCSVLKVRWVPGKSTGKGTEKGYFVDAYGRELRSLKDLI